MLIGLLILVAILFILGLPRWPHSAQWGYGPSGGLALVLLVVVLILVFGGAGSTGASLSAHGCNARW